MWQRNFFIISTIVLTGYFLFIKNDRDLRDFNKILFTPMKNDKILSSLPLINMHVIVNNENQENLKFPPEFLIGSASSAYQIEGGWNEQNKTPSIWDNFVHHHKNSVADNSTGDIGPDSFHKFDEDLKALKIVGFQHYRFSISWPRIIPNESTVNNLGIEYYSKIIDKLIENNIEPVITIFHWDVPSWLHDLGGTTSPVFVDHFKIFANVLFENFGARVKKWVTINEPFNFCTCGYGDATWAPGIKSRGVGEYLCVHHLILANAAAYHLYKEKFYSKQNGSIGIVLDSRFYFPKNESVTKEDLHRAQTYRLGWYAQPIFGKDGGYPQIMIDEIGNRSENEGRNCSRLPTLEGDLKRFVKGTSDFFGLNYYTSRLLSVENRKLDPNESPAWYKDSKNIISVDPKWKVASNGWLYNVPDGLRGMLNWIKNEYDNPEIFITENGWSDTGTLEDNGRIEYFKSHMDAVLKAIHVDKCKIIGYTAWSLLDSFEWDRGYLDKFGIFSVNFSSPKRDRIVKKSAKWFKKVIESRKLVEVDEIY